MRPPRFLSERTVATLLGPGDAPKVVEFFAANREHLQPWSPTWAEDFLEEAAWSERLAQARDEFQRGTAMRLFLSLRSDPAGAVIGNVNFSQAFRGPFQAAYLGYALGQSSEGQGLMFEALQAVLEPAMAVLGIRRVMANYKPENERSGALLQRLGFEVEGFAKQYLKINGEWSDHVLTSYRRS